MHQPGARPAAGHRLRAADRQTDARLDLQQLSPPPPSSQSEDCLMCTGAPWQRPPLSSPVMEDVKSPVQSGLPESKGDFSAAQDEELSQSDQISSRVHSIQTGTLSIDHLSL